MFANGWGMYATILGFIQLLIFNKRARKIAVKANC